MLYKEEEFVDYMVYRRVDASWWNRLIANPKVIKDKKKAPLVIWGSHVKKPELTDKGYMRCTGANVDELYALPIDVDNGTTMESFERDYSRYAYQLYTTHSWHNGKDGDRFRAFFPLKEPIKVKWLVPPVKDILWNMFDMVDKSCFDQGHWQKLPCVCSRNADYRYVQHDGARLSFARDNFEKLATEYREDFHWKREISKADADPSASRAGALRHVQEVFDQTVEGERDRTVYSKLCWLVNEKHCTYDEVISLRPPVGFDEEYVKKVNRFYGHR